MKKPPPLSEAKLEKMICDYARLQDCITYKFTSPGNRGVPDRIIITPYGKVLFLEIKAPGRIPTTLQLREITRIVEQGGTATWTSSFEDFKAYLDLLIDG